MSQRKILPGNVKPTHYVVNLTPNLESFAFKGTMQVTLNVKEATASIQTNAHELVVSSANIIVHHLKSETKQVAKISTNQADQIVTFDFEQEIPAGATVVLHAEFTGIHNDQMAGFYRSSYTDAAGNKKFLVVTQCEATDCRRIFPCWDEPNQKATFDVILNVEQHLVPLANMNVIEETTVNIDGKTLKSVKFATTPKMSPYLFALAVGEFDYLEAEAKPKHPADAKPIKCRTYTLKGQAELGRFSVGVMVKVLEFFSEYFGIAYPLPKMDMIAIPDFGAGAMENWGLVTYREVLLLFDEAKTSASSKKRIAYVIGHELAHQWFGNLVTMDWWNELWLNEGFATFVGWLATDHCFPDWKVWTSFVTDEVAQGLGLDALRSSHAIDIDVNSPSEINQIFDAISYSKGASVIRMLDAYLGRDKFALGVSNYLKKHSYGNAKTTDLWSALSEVSGKDVNSVMHSWTKEMGFPMLSVVKEHYDDKTKTMTLTLKQQRYLSSGDLKPEEDNVLWKIPINVVTHLDTVNYTEHLLEAKEGTISFKYDSDENAFYKLNFRNTGFYRVCYSDEHLKRLGRAVENNPTRFSTEDRIGILSDAFAFSRAGYSRTSAALSLIKGFAKEEDYHVLEVMSTSLNNVSAAWYKDAKIVAGIKGLKKYLFVPKIAKYGYSYDAKEDFLTQQKRTLVIAAAAHADDEGVIAELKKKFVANDLHPNLRGVVIATALRHSSDPKHDFEKVLDIYKSSDSVDARLDALSNIGAINDMNLVFKLLEMTIDTEVVKTQDITRPIGGLISSTPFKEQVLEMIWPWVVKNWVALHKQLSSTIALLGNLVKLAISRQIGLDFVAKVESWANCEDCKTQQEKDQRKEQLVAVKRPMDQALETVRSMTKWATTDHESVLAWVSSALSENSKI